MKIRQYYLRQEKLWVTELIDEVMPSRSIAAKGNTKEESHEQALYLRNRVIEEQERKV